MKISIDTAQDSREDIRKAIRLLQALVEHDASQGSRNIFDDPVPDLFGNTSASGSSSPASSNQTSAFADLFSDNAPTQQPSAPAVPERKERIPEIEFY
jgi:hypothetical protein